MSNYAILRLEKRGLSPAMAMARHALREQKTPTPNADPERLNDNVIEVGPGTVAGIRAAIRAKLPPNRRKNAVPVIELFVGGSPEAMHEMSKAQQLEYFKDALRWAGERFGGDSNIVSAIGHFDEATPHLQVLLVPLLNGKLNARELVGDRKKMVEMQTSFADLVGKRHGLRRGEQGSTAKHTTIRQFYAAIERAGSADALPPQVHVPEMLQMPKPLPAPGLLATAAEKAAHAKREKEREVVRKANVKLERDQAAAQQANAKRQKEIERLARVGLAVKGKAARTDLPEVHSKLAAAEAAYAEKLAFLKAADAEVAAVTEKLELVQARLKSLERRLPPQDTQEATDEQIVDPGALRRGQRSR